MEIHNRVGPKAFEGENFGIAAEHVGARELSYPLGTGVEMRDAMRTIDDDDAIVGAFQRRQQNFRSFSHKTIRDRHRWIRNASGKCGNRTDANAAMVSKTFLQYGRGSPRRDMLNDLRRRQR
jgi:hypothetical protein